MSGHPDGNRLTIRAAGDGVEWADAAFLDHRFAPHRHDTYAIGFTTHGVQSFTYRKQTWHALPGNAFILHPDELHDGRAGTEAGFGYRILYVAPDLICAALDRTELPFVAEPVSAGAPIAAALRQAFSSPADAMDTVYRTDCLCRIADALQHAAGRRTRRRDGSNPRLMRTIREHLSAQCVHGVAMPELERLYGLDRFSISRQFQRTFGVNPHRFITMRRLDLVKRHINAGIALAEAAAAAGFSDQSHMTRHFRAAFGVSPGQWRRLTGAGSSQRRSKASFAASPRNTAPVSQR